MWLRTVVYCSTVVLLFALIIAVIRGMRISRRKRDRQDRNARRCPCGYLLIGLPLPRCPECGRAIGFDKSFEEMGISKEELRAYKAESPTPAHLQPNAPLPPPQSKVD